MGSPKSFAAICMEELVEPNIIAEMRVIVQLVV